VLVEAEGVALRPSAAYCEKAAMLPTGLEGAEFTVDSGDPESD
jgi:hypothetical protein